MLLAIVVTCTGVQADTSKDDVERSGEENPEETSGQKTTRPTKFDGTFKIPNTEATIKIGGFARLDVIHDFDAIGSEDKFDPGAIPTDGASGENTRLHAKWTRLNVDFGRPTRFGSARIFVETDFMDSEDSAHLRHAFARVGPLLVGQTWSTFMDEDAIPPTLDLEEPRAFFFVRQAMVRWTWDRSERFQLAIGLEEPDAEIEAPEGVPGSTEDPLPDLTARARWKWGESHLQLSSFVGEARFRADAGSKDDATLWGLSLTGKATTVGKDALRFQLAYGEGVARYIGGLAAAADGNGQLEALEAYGGVLSYQHYWSKRLSSHLVGSYGSQDNSAGQSSESIHATVYAALNTVWEFAERMSFGGEWLYGEREDNDGASGHAHRLLLVFKMDFF
jgi:hypothetical protein